MNEQYKNWDWNEGKYELLVEHENHDSHQNKVQEVKLTVFEFFWFLRDLTPSVLTQQDVFEVVDTYQCNEESRNDTNQSSEMKKHSSWDDLNIFVTDQNLQEESR